MINIHAFCSLCSHKMVCTYKDDFREVQKRFMEDATLRGIFGDEDNLLEWDLRCKYYSKEMPNIKGV